MRGTNNSGTIGLARLRVGRAMLKHTPFAQSAWLCLLLFLVLLHKFTPLGICDIPLFLLCARACRLTSFCPSSLLSRLFAFALSHLRTLSLSLSPLSPHSPLSHTLPHSTLISPLPSIPCIPSHSTNDTLPDKSSPRTPSARTIREPPDTARHSHVFRKHSLACIA